MDKNIEILSGGRMNQTVKIGNTVHKTSKGSPIVRDYLLYLEKAGMFRIIFTPSRVKRTNGYGMIMSHNTYIITFLIYFTKK